MNATGTAAAIHEATGAVTDTAERAWWNDYHPRDVAALAASLRHALAVLENALGRCPDCARGEVTWAATGAPWTVVCGTWAMSGASWTVVCGTCDGSGLASLEVPR